MTTQFYNPTTITQYSEQDDLIQPIIEWNINGAITQDNYITSKQPLYTISGLWMEKYLSHTSELWCTGFNIPESDQELVGIELFLNVHRNSRIEDLRIQLIDSTGLIGDNLASPIDPVQSNMYTGDNSPLLPVIGNENSYSSASNLWGTTLTSAQITDPNFGVAISFRSNQVYPHRDFAIVFQVSVGVTYG
jgi:hypothetical protein